MAEQTSEKILDVIDVTMRFGGVVALSNVFLDVRLGEIHALIGPNGSGKSTLINLIGGIYKPLNGRILMDGRDLIPLEIHHRAELRIGRTFQNLRLARTMNVLENVLVGMHSIMPKGFSRNVLRLPGVAKTEERSLDEAFRLLESVGLNGREHTLAKNLSHAEIKRLELARALACSPRLLLLDEPTAGLGDEERDELIEIVTGVVRTGAVGVLLVEHSMRTVMSVSDRISVLDEGIKIAEGLPREIQRDECVIEAYLGRSTAPC